MDVLSLPDVGGGVPRSRSATMNTMDNGEPFIRSNGVDSFAMNGVRASIRRSGNHMGLQRHATRYMSRRQRPVVPAISRMQSMAVHGELAGRARHNLGRVRSFHGRPPSHSPYIPVVFDMIDQQPMPTRSRATTVLALGNDIRQRSESKPTIGLITLDQLEMQLGRQWEEEEEEYTKIGLMCLSITKKVLPCCNDDDESFGHHLSIALVALLSFSTLVFVTLILVLVFYL